AQWLLADDEALVEGLEAEKLAGHQTDNGWKPCTWTVIEAVVNAVRTRGAFKTGTKCKDHWRNTLLPQYRDIVKWSKNFSGFGWDSETKMFTASEEVWDDLIKAQPKAKVLWDGKRFPLYERIHALMEGQHATGAATVRIPQPTESVSTPATPTRTHAQTTHAESPASEPVEGWSPSPISCKRRSPTFSPSAGRSSRRARVTGPTAINNVASALGQMAQAAISLPLTPLKRATAAIESDVLLTEEDKLDLLFFLPD
ncbi:uncharacterized protein BXZ73DRAFT_57941, partial [Epithele typhae]|uniref:uncharacterized protein n=1 Tax=Epithele typhae TaxID=378194 RepID=UPI00200738C4